MADLLYEKNEEEHYAVFTMNRPQALNAMGGSMNEELNVALHDFNNDREMWAGIVTGNGRAFSAGAETILFAMVFNGFRETVISDVFNTALATLGS